MCVCVCCLRRVQPHKCSRCIYNILSDRLSNSLVALTQHVSGYICVYTLRPRSACVHSTHSRRDIVGESAPNDIISYILYLCVMCVGKHESAEFYYYLSSPSRRWPPPQPLVSITAPRRNSHGFLSEYIVILLLKHFIVEKQHILLYFYYYIMMLCVPRSQFYPESFKSYTYIYIYIFSTCGE